MVFVNRIWRLIVVVLFSTACPFTSASVSNGGPNQTLKPAPIFGGMASGGQIDAPTEFEIANLMNQLIVLSSSWHDCLLDDPSINQSTFEKGIDLINKIYPLLLFRNDSNSVTTADQKGQLDQIINIMNSCLVSVNQNQIIK